VTGGWRKLHEKKLHNLYSLPNIIGMIKSKRMRWDGHVAQIWERRSSYTLLVVKARRKETTRKTGQY
jgi:hypothetical protein